MDDITFVGILEVLLLWMVLYNYIIPLSLYVSLEFQKFVSSIQFVWDSQLYDPESDEPAQGNNQPTQPCTRVLLCQKCYRSKKSL